MNRNYLVSVFVSFFCCFSYSQGAYSPVDSLKQILKFSKIDTVQVNLLNKIADKFKESNPDSTIYYTKKATLLATKIRYDFGQATADLNFGNAEIVLGDYKSAMKNFRKAEKIFLKLLESDDESSIKLQKNGLAKAYASQGIVYSQESKYFDAIDYYQKSLSIYEETNNKPSICRVLNNIGIVYKSQLNYTKALEYFEKGLLVQQEIGEQSAAVTLTNIGVIYAEQGNKLQVLNYFNRAKKIFEKSDNKRGFALLNNYYGDFYLKEKNYVKAQKYYQEALKLYDYLQNKFGSSLVLYNLGNLNLELKKFDTALELANKSLNQANEIGVLDQIYHTEKLLSDLYALKNNQERSFFHYKNYITARDSITNQESAQKILRAEMESEYKSKTALFESEAKRKNQLLFLSIIGAFLLIGLLFVMFNRMQIKKRLTLQKEVAEYEQKALHLQMNPHFVFNCLSSISSFIVQNGTYSALKYLSKFSKLMRLTLEYSKGALIPIDKEIEGLQNYLELEQLRFHNKFIFSVNATDKVEFNMAIPPLLVQPFVENAILHGMVPKEGDGCIDVLFDVENGQFICKIQDDGIGLTESKVMKENSVKAHKSMALDITKKRLEIMEATTDQKATIEINDMKKNNQICGTEVILRLPIQFI